MNSKIKSMTSHEKIYRVTINLFFMGSKSEMKNQKLEESFLFAVVSCLVKRTR